MNGHHSKNEEISHTLSVRGMDFIFDIDYKIKELVVSSKNQIINCLNVYKY